MFYLIETSQLPTKLGLLLYLYFTDEEIETQNN